jgi:hypothetical protein
MDEKPQSEDRAATVSSESQNRDTIGSMIERHFETHAVGPDNARSSRRRDEQLVAALDEPGEWSGHDRLGNIIFSADTLREALVRYATVKVRVVALCLKPDDSVIVSEQQIENVNKLVE